MNDQHPKDENGMFICLECDKRLKSLSAHMKFHKITTWEYLIKHNLSGKTDLMGEKTIAKLIKNSKHHGTFGAFNLGHKKYN